MIHKTKLFSVRGKGLNWGMNTRSMGHWGAIFRDQLSESLPSSKSCRDILPRLLQWVHEYDNTNLTGSRFLFLSLSLWSLMEGQ